MPQARRIAWEDLKALTPKDWLAKDPRESDCCIETIYGSKLWVFGLDKPQRVEGSPWDGCVLDESSDLDPLTFDRIVYPALSDRNGWCWRIGVPKRKGRGAAVYKEAFDRALLGEDEESEAFTWFSSDILAPEVIKHAQSVLDAKTYREQFEGSWENAGGLVYYMFMRARNVRPVEYVPQLPLLIFSDFNVNPMAWCVAQDVKGVIQVIDELFLRDTNTRSALDVLWSRWGERHKGEWEFYGDATADNRHTSASVSDYQQILGDPRFRKAGRRVKYPRHNPPVVDRYAAVNSRLCSLTGEVRVLIDPRCKQLIKDIETLPYEEDSREAETGGDRTHASDALGYGIYYKYPVSAAAMLEESGEKRPAVRYNV